MTNHSNNLSLFTLYKELARKYGRLKWWSVEEPFEIMVGAILVQNTNWRNAANAINSLKMSGQFSPEAITGLSLKKLIKLIKSAGLYNQKAQRLKALCAWYINKSHFKLLKRRRTITLRAQLLAIKGIGNETADAILLYAFNRPIFVIDAYTQRLLIHLKFIDKKRKYEDLQRLFHGALPKNVYLFRQYHALIVHHSKLNKTSKVFRRTSVDPLV